MIVENKPYPHILIENILSEEDAMQLLMSLETIEFFPKFSDLFSFSQSHDLNKSTIPEIVSFKEFMLSDQIIAQIEAALDVQINKEKLDYHATLYQDTDYLLPHDDQLDSRNVAFLLYLSDLTENDGGALGLFDEKPSSVVKQIYPQFNRLVCFKVSDISYHEVQEILSDTQRIAIGGWYHAK